MRPFKNLVNSALKGGKKAENGNPADDGTPKTVTYWDEERNKRRPECVKCQEILPRGPPCRCNLCGAFNVEILSDDDARIQKTKSSNGGSSSSNSSSNKDGKNKNAGDNGAAKEENPLDQDWQSVMVYRPNRDFVPKSQS